MLILRQLVDAASSSYTYLLGDADSGRAVLIDPVYENVRRDGTLLRELGLAATLNTHVHADHVTAAWLLKQRCGSQILLSEDSGAAHTDQPLRHGDRVAFGARHLEVRATPGHTSGCLSNVLDNHSMVFTGDALLICGCGRTDFQQGSPTPLYQSVRAQILSLPAACLLYPAHDYRGLMVTSVGEGARAFSTHTSGSRRSHVCPPSSRRLASPGGAVARRPRQHHESRRGAGEPGNRARAQTQQGRLVC